MINKTIIFLPLVLLISNNNLSARSNRGHYGRTHHTQAAQSYNQTSARPQARQQQVDQPQEYTNQDTLDTTSNSGGSMSEITCPEELHQALNSSEPTIIYCTADWCEACTKHMEPVINKAANSYGNRVNFKKLDMGDKKLKKETDKLRISGLPTMIFRRDGKQIVMQGSRPETYFMGQVKAFINGTMKPEETTTSPVKSSKK